MVRLSILDVTWKEIRVGKLALMVPVMTSTDQEVESVCAHLRSQGAPDYLDAITDDPDGDGDGDDFGGGEGGSGDDLYDRAVAVVTRDRKASTSYIQRRLQIGYNRAASLIERMEKEGVVTPANHAGKRDILAGPPPV